MQNSSIVCVIFDHSLHFSTIAYINLDYSLQFSYGVYSSQPSHANLDTRGAPDLEFSNPAGTGFTGFGQKFRRKFRPDLPDLKQDILG